MTKIINDPVHGFIRIHDDLILQCIDHPYFQRLRNISQLGLTNFVYPGATHSRFHHSIGAYHLMQTSLMHLRNNGVSISQEEILAACIAILLHDIGHGPYSHTLEHCIMKGISHESISLELMKEMNIDFKGALDLAIEIFKGSYSRPFFKQLISSQLDMDRLDYLKRDSFYTGVIEGNISVERIIAMLDVVDNQLIVYEKGAMSIEDYLLSRKIMYWQVYLHKTVLSVENMLVNIFKRIEELLLVKKIDVHSASSTIQYFFELKKSPNNVMLTKDILDHFVLLDDTDIWQLVKECMNSKDYILKTLSHCIFHRKLYKVTSSMLQDDFDIKYHYTLTSEADISYFRFEQEVDLTTYSHLNSILIYTKSNQIVPFEAYLTSAGFGKFKEKNKKFFYFQLPESFIMS